VNSKCRILYLLGQLRPGGQERQLYYLLQAIDRGRYQPAIAVWNYGTRDDLYVEELERLGVPIYSCSDGASAQSELAELRRLVTRVRPEIIHSYCFYMNAVAWCTALGSQSIPIGSVRQDFVNERWQVPGVKGLIAGVLSARFPNFQIFNSSTAKSAAEESKTLFKPRRIYVVPNAVDVKRIECYPPPENAALLAIGRLEPEKRWDRLLTALGILSEHKVKFSIRLAGDGPLRKQLQLQATQLGLNGRIEFLGRRNDIPSLLKQSSFLVHTAEAEGCPNVILEAMAAGRAAVATDAGDVPRLIENGETGFIVRRGDDTALVNCVAKLISNPDLSFRMGQAARIKAEREFGLDRLVSNTLAAYRAAGWQE
jgi:glycosyltransferase involved in cell wall biosynthesis